MLDALQKIRSSVQIQTMHGLPTDLFSGQISPAATALLPLLAYDEIIIGIYLETSTRGGMTRGPTIENDGWCEIRKTDVQRYTCRFHEVLSCIFPM